MGVNRSCESSALHRIALSLRDSHLPPSSTPPLWPTFLCDKDIALCERDPGKYGAWKQVMAPDGPGHLASPAWSLLLTVWGTKISCYSSKNMLVCFPEPPGDLLMGSLGASRKPQLIYAFTGKEQTYTCSKGLAMVQNSPFLWVHGPHE